MEVLVNASAHRPRPGREGMTLIEMMVALAIFAVVTTVVIGFLTGSRRTYESTSDRAHYQQSARAVLSLVTRELRSAGCDPTEVGIEKLVVADATTLRCRMDLDGDGSTLGTNPDEDIRYVYDATSAELWRTTASGTVTILRDVDGLFFDYRDADGALLGTTPLTSADRERVRFVDIQLSGELDNGEPVTYQTRIHLRNG